MERKTLILSLFLAVFLFICINRVNGIKCWLCNSHLDPKCSDPFDNSTANFKVCNRESAPPHLVDVPATMCRKIRMKIMGEWRIKRDCAHLGEPGLDGDERYCIYRSGTYNIHMEYCTCNDKDGCNSAKPHSTSVWTVVLIVALGLTIIKCFRLT